MSGFPGSSSFPSRQLQRAPSVAPPVPRLDYAPPPVRPQHLDIRGGSVLRGFQPLAQRGGATSAIVPYNARFAARQLGRARLPINWTTLSRAGNAASLVLLAADLMELAAPGVHSWLTGGWKGASGRGLPADSVQVVNASGRNATVYNVQFRGRWRRPDGVILTGTSTFRQVMGPISSIQTRVVPTVPGSASYQYFVTDGSGSVADSVSVNGPDTPDAREFLGAEFLTLTRADGQPDTDPNPTTVVTLPSYATNPAPTSSAYIPRPSTPPTANYRSTEDLSRLFSEEVERRGYLENPAPSVTPNGERLPSASGSVPAPLPLPSPGNTASAPKNRPERVEEGDECDRVGIKLERLLDDLSDKLDDLKECACKEREVEIEIGGQGIEWRYPIVRCIDGQVSIEQRLIYVAQLPPDSYREEIRQMANASATVCVGVAPASVPDYWPVKVGAGRPQLELTFRQAGTSGYLSICIPHPASTEPWTEDLFGDYWSGNFSGMVRLSDNSQIVVNCDSESEANRVLDVAIGLVNPSMLPSDPDRRVVERRGMVVKRTKRLLRKVSYFSQGQRDLRPDWTRRVPSFNIL